MNYLNFCEVPVDSGFKMADYWVWCGSVIEEPGNGFHMYAARWPKSYPMFEGYIYLSEIVRAWSATMQGPYEFVEKILPGNDSPEWCSRMTHNPTVLKYCDQYLLFFIGSSYDFETPCPDKIEENRDKEREIYNRIRIGLAIADSPAGLWKTVDLPILEPRPGKWDNQIVTNPAPCVLPDGRIFLYYRSNTPDGLRIGLAEAKRTEGPYERVQDESVLDNFHVEDPFVWHNGRRFHMLAKDITGEITGEPLAGAHFVSENGINWQVGTIVKGYSRTITFDDGKIQKLGCLERPQLLLDSAGRPKCMFAAAADGPGSFRKAYNTWNIALPLQEALGENENNN